MKLKRGKESVEVWGEDDPMYATYRSIGFSERGETAPPPPEIEPEPEAEAPAEWPLKSTTPAEYIEQHGEDEDLSETVAERLALARKLVAAEG